MLETEKQKKIELIKSKIKEEGDYKELIIDGFTCIIKRPFKVYLCGYVVLPNTKEYANYNKIDCFDEYNFDVHGGITYCDYGITDIKGNRIYDKNFVLGFDCAHLYDLCDLEFDFEDEIYRDMDYVENELRKLVRQLKDKDNDTKNI